jgi:hypothetical protein
MARFGEISLSQNRAMPEALEKERLIVFCCVILSSRSADAMRHVGNERHHSSLNVSKKSGRMYEAAG